MRIFTIVASLLMFLAGCAGDAPTQTDPRSQSFRANLAASPGLARVYLLPTYSKGLFRDLDGRAAFAIFAQGSERGSKLGATSKTTFLAFDIAPGEYDIQATGDDPLTRVTKPFLFESAKSYFLRPAFFRAAKEMAGGSAQVGMGFDALSSGEAAAQLGGLEMAALTPEGEAFLARTAGGQVQRTVVVVPPAPAVQPTGGADFTAIERKLKELKQLWQEGLITQQDYDSKRDTLLKSY